MPRIRACFIFCFLILSGFTANAQESGTGTEPELVKAIDALLAAPELQTGWQGIVVQSVTDNAILYERNADKVFLPASNNKLLTSAAALGLLGTDFAYHTRVYRKGILRPDGSLQGDLILRGAGDPLLSPPELKALTKKVKQAGIRRISGRVMYDDSCFDKQRLGNGWAWDDEKFYYSAQVGALNLNENMVYIQLIPGKKAGDAVRIIVGPTARYTTLINTATTGPAKSKSTIVIDRERGRNALTIRGTLPLDIAPKENAPVGVTIEDPARFTAFVFQEYLRQAGIRVSGTLCSIGLTPQDAVLVAEHVSAPLPILLKRLNKPSDNLVAECLLKTIGAVKAKSGGAGTDGTSAKTATEWLRSIGLDSKRLQLTDGSGLSRYNFVSPRNLVQLLVYLRSRPDFTAFYESLPIAGVDGSLRRRLKGTPAENNCHAKTGTMSHVSSLSGYVTTADSEILVFSILMNNHLTGARTCTAVQDKIVALLAGYSRKKADHAP